MAQRWFGRIAGVAGLAIALGAASAASATTYYLKDVVFDDGTVATGSFSTNVSGFPGPYDITTVTGAIAGFHYLPTINVTYNPGDSAITFFHDNPDYQGFLQLTAVNPLDAGLPDALVTGANGPSFECSDFGCPNGVARYIVSGSLVATVPEAGAWALMLVGLGAAGYALRSGRKVARA